MSTFGCCSTRIACPRIRIVFYEVTGVPKKLFFFNLAVEAHFKMIWKQQNDTKTTRQLKQGRHFCI